ncbi:protein phosphatase 2C domain-containing protein [Streptomyces alboniger]|uniref:protein phosphatase 2C domain-containing protein n=1 Tax=Streptomyces alboniger TaxID=132473 RepID=UPI003CCC5F86
MGPAEPRSAGPRSSQPWPVESGSAQRGSAGPAAAGPPSVESRSVKSRSVEPGWGEPCSAGSQPAGPQSAEPQPAGPRPAGPQSFEPRAPGPQPSEPRASEPETSEPRSAEPRPPSPGALIPPQAPPDPGGPAPTPPPAPPTAQPAPSDPARPGGPPPAPPSTLVTPAPWEPPTGPTGPVTFGAGSGPVAGTPPRPPVPGSRRPGSPRTEAAAGPAGAAPSPFASAGPAYVGDRPPTYEAEPTALPAADPDDLGDLVADTVLDGARYGSSTLRAASVRGDSARYRGEPRRDSLLTARFGTGEDALVLVAMATGARATPGAHRAAAEACEWIGRAVGRSHQRLAEDIRAARRGDLKSGLHRLTDRSLGKLRAHAADLGLQPDEYAASLRCLLLPADPQCRTRVFFGVGAGGLFRLREGEWQDIEPRVADATGEAVVGFGSPPPQTPEGDRLTMDLGITTPPSPYEPAPEPPRDPFRFRASVARPGDTLLLCSGGLAEPLRGEPELAEHLTLRWQKSGPPGLAAFLADIQVRVKGYADDRTAAAVWEA